MLFSLAHLFCVIYFHPSYVKYQVLITYSGHHYFNPCRNRNSCIK